MIIYQQICASALQFLASEVIFCAIMSLSETSLRCKIGKLFVGNNFAESCFAIFEIVMNSDILFASLQLLSGVATLLREKQIDGKIVK